MYDILSLVLNSFRNLISGCDFNSVNGTIGMFNTYFLKSYFDFEFQSQDLVLFEPEN